MAIDYRAWTDHDLILWLCEYGERPGTRRTRVRLEAEARRRGLRWWQSYIHTGDHRPGWRRVISLQRYQICPIGPIGDGDGIDALELAVAATDDADDAKALAERRAYDYDRGVAILDRVAHVIDWGDRITDYTGGRPHHYHRRQS